MTFDYEGKQYQGTRAEIQESLKVEISRLPLTWSYGSWHLGSYSLQCDCSPSQAKAMLTKQIINKIPLNKIARVEGNDIIITNCRGDTRRVSIYDI